MKTKIYKMLLYKYAKKNKKLRAFGKNHNKRYHQNKHKLRNYMKHCHSMLKPQ